MTAIYSACYIIRSCSCSVIWLAGVFQLIFYKGREINSSDDDSSSSINREDENSSIEEKIILLSLSVLYFKLDAILVSVNRYSFYLASQCFTDYFVLRRIFYSRQNLKRFMLFFYMYSLQGDLQHQADKRRVHLDIVMGPKFLIHLFKQSPSPLNPTHSILNFLDLKHHQIPHLNPITP